MEQKEIKRSEADQEWQIAGDRMLLYLRCLNFTVPQALHYVLRAMQEAKLSMKRGGSENNPLVDSMHALHHILSEPGKTKAPEHNHVFLDTWCERPVHSSPPINRLSMVSEK